MSDAEQDNALKATEIVEQTSVGRVSGFTRRVFLRGSVGLAAAGAAVATVPGLSSALVATENETPAVDGAASTAGVEGVATGSSNFAEPLIAHVKDLQTGEMSLFFGEKEISFNDPGLASRLFRAARN